MLVLIFALIFFLSLLDRDETGQGELFLKKKKIGR